MAKHLVLLIICMNLVANAQEESGGGWVRDKYCDSRVDAEGMYAMVLGGQRPQPNQEERIPSSDKLCLVNVGLTGKGFSRIITVRDDGMLSITDNLNNVLKSEIFYLVPRSQTKVDLKKTDSGVEVQWPYDGTATIDAKKPIIKADALGFFPQNLAEIPLHSVPEFALRPKNGISIDLGMARENSPILEAIRTGNFNAPVKMADSNGNKCQAIPMSDLLVEKPIDSYSGKYESALRVYRSKKNAENERALAVAKRKRMLTSEYSLVSDDAVLALIKEKCKNLDVSYLEQETFINSKAKLSSAAPNYPSKGNPGSGAKAKETKP